jgi:hypothetical protein
MDEIDDAVAAAWNRVKPLIADKPSELRKRLNRHRQPALQRTPRARCLAVRANDLRIDGTHVPPGGDAWRHEVTLDAPEIRRLCAPVEIDAPGESRQEVAAKLGVTPMGLVQARLRGVFNVRHVAGLGGYWGHPVPILYTDKQLAALRAGRPDLGLAGARPLPAHPAGLSADHRTPAVLPAPGMALRRGRARSGRQPDAAATQSALVEAPAARARPGLVQVEGR